MNRYYSLVRNVLDRRSVALMALLLLIGVATIVGNVHAQTPIIQGYLSDSTLERGRIVNIDPKNPQKVVATTTDNIDKMYGVVVDPNDAPVTLTQADQRIFVASAGRYEVLVSSENGAIAIGDYISLSNSDGVGAKVTATQKIVLGKALQPFDGHTNAITKTQDGAGIIRILVDINVGKNPGYKNNDVLPDFLRKTGDAIAGKQVNPLRIYLGLGLLVVTCFITTSILYAGVRNALISIGRNPLSKKSITKGMIQVLLFGMIVFILGVFGVYLLLKI